MKCSATASVMEGPEQALQSAPFVAFRRAPRPPFTAKVNAAGVMDFLETVADVAYGTRCVLEILGECQRAKANDQLPLLNDNHLGGLERLAIRAALMLESKCDSTRDWVMGAGQGDLH